ncbi:MAG: hypothetical protein IT442_16350 [Phycisphaeraceae bacterium]|nr:hypothetical protein [Phycisphaeraceae bacterium]
MFLRPLSFCLLVVLAQSALATPSYQYVDLRHGEAYGINNSGVVVGASVFGVNVTDGYSWKDGVFTRLQTLGGYNVAFDINDSGVVAGYTSDSGNHQFAVSWTNRLLTQLNVSGNGRWAQALNDAGIVVGTNTFSAVRWDAGVASFLPTLADPYDNYVRAMDINTAGTIVGYGEAGWNEASKAIVWTGNTAQELPNLGGYRAAAHGINDAGSIVGWAELPGDWLPYLGDRRMAVRWDNGVPTPLGQLGGKGSSALAINESGVAVGWTAWPASGNNRAAVFMNGDIFNLNSITVGVPTGMVLCEATDINDAGWIVGWGAGFPGETGTHAFLLVPVPEPSALAILLITAALLRRSR